MDHVNAFRKVRSDSRRAINWLSVSDLSAVPSPTLDQMANLRKCRRATLNGIRRLRNHKIAGRIEKVRRAESTFRSAFSVKLMCVVRAVHRKGLRLPFASIEKIAKAIDFSKPCLEPSAIVLKPKEVGGKRAVSRYGIEATARQYIAEYLLTATIDGNPYEYACAGRGSKSVSLAIKGAIHDGYIYWIETDVISCFASLKPSDFEDLPLQAAIKADILSNQRAKPTNPDKLSTGDWELIQAARQTLPQGAASSSLVASAFLGRELKPLMAKAKVVLFTYCDNIIIGARCAEEAKAFADALKEHFQSLPAGPLTIKVGSCEDVRHRADVLGWRFKFRHKDDEAKVTMCPRPRSFYRFEKRLLKKLRTWGDDYEARALDYSRCWATSLAWKLNEISELYLDTTVMVCLLSENDRRSKISGPGTKIGATVSDKDDSDISVDEFDHEPPWNA